MRRHVDEVAVVCEWMLKSGHANTVSQITASLVDFGGLALACQAQNGMMVLGDVLENCPAQELVRYAWQTHHMP